MSAAVSLMAPLPRSTLALLHLCLSERTNCHENMLLTKVRNTSLAYPPPARRGTRRRTEGTWGE